MSLSSILTIAIEAAETAGLEIMRLRSQGQASRSLTGAESPVTAADLAAEKCIIDRLKSADPSTPIVSEESKTTTEVKAASRKRYWLVDPLDGTKEFLAGTDEFAVNIALMQDGVPVLGVIHAPAMSETYFAWQGGGAFKRSSLAALTERTRIYSSDYLPSQPGPRVLCSRSHPEPELENWTKRFSGARWVPMGSSLKFACLAEGKADLYPRFQSLFEWDVAAGDCLFRESGRSKPRHSNIRYADESVPHPRRASPFALGVDSL